jgi:hypothetical protein
MGSLWEGIRKAAATGAAKAQTAAENALHRLELQKKIAQREAELAQTFTAIGRETYAVVRGGGQAPAGVTVDAVAIAGVEAEIERLKAELATYGGGDAAHPGTHP